MSVGPDSKLAAILHADVVGYSRLMAEDEDSTIRTITAYREEIELLLEQHQGRLVDFTGDNFLAEFASAVGAARCATEIQRALGPRNAALGSERRMDFRIGIHLGEVRTQGERLFGTGVNVAARIQALAQPGGVCISDKVREELRNRLELGYEDLGEQTVKNIPERVRVFRVLTEGPFAATGLSKPKLRWPLASALALLLGVLAIAAWRVALRDPAGTPAVQTTDSTLFGRPALAVLPFDNLSGDPEQEYFVDGLAEDLITRLSLWRRFPVISGSSSAAYEKQTLDLKQLSRELSARYVVDGSVQRVGDRVRVSAQLIDATTGHHVWTERYDRRIDNVLALQEELSLAIVGAMYPELERFDRERAARGNPGPEAWDWTQRAWWYWNHETLADNGRARSAYERAIELDPRFATAQSGLALTLYQSISNGWAHSVDQSIEEMGRLAKSAVALDDRDPTNHHALGHVHALTGDRDSMLAAFELSIELNPSSALVRACAGEAMALAGRSNQAISELQAAIRLSPRDPAIHWTYQGLALAHFAAERYEEAVGWAQRALQRRPDFAFAYRTLAATYVHLGRQEEAGQALDQALQLAPDFTLAAGRRVLLTADAQVRERYLEGLRLAGLSE